jgi:hypothetical protein
LTDVEGFCVGFGGGIVLPAFFGEGKEIKILAKSCRENQEMPAKAFELLMDASVGVGKLVGLGS